MPREIDVAAAIIDHIRRPPENVTKNDPPNGGRVAAVSISVNLCGICGCGGGYYVYIYIYVRCVCVELWRISLYVSVID